MRLICWTNSTNGGQPAVDLVCHGYVNVSGKCHSRQSRAVTRDHGPEFRLNY